MIWFAAASMITVVLLAMEACRRSRWRVKVILVELLRVALVATTVWMLWQPETVYQVESDQKPSIVLLVDRSESMQSADVMNDAEIMSRAMAADVALANESLGQLSSRFNLVVVPFAKRSPDQSDLANAVSEAAIRYPESLATILISDGDWNGAKSPLDAAASFRLHQTDGGRLFSVGVGSEDALPDVELVSALIPAFAISGKPLRVPVTIGNWMSTTQQLRVSLRTGSGEGNIVAEQTLTVKAGARTRCTLQWTAGDAGDSLLTVDVSKVDGESNFENNRLVKQIELRDETLRVLIVESEPRWEFRYLRNALIRDPGVTVSTLLFQPKLSQVGGGGDDYLKLFPVEPGELASYDVVFLGDVGVAAKQLSGEDCRQLAGLVKQQASGLVLMPGPRGYQSSLLSTELAELFPVALDEALPRGVGSTIPGQFSLTSAGRTSLLTELEDEREMNWKRWTSLPGFSWHAAVVRPTAGSEVLAVHSETSNEYGRLPLLVTRAAGAGKVLFMATDGAWRWRQGVEDRYHYRFWGQVIRWMAYQRNMAAGQRMRLSFLPEQPQPGETVAFRASVMTEGGAPLNDDRFLLKIRAPGGDTQSLSLEPTDGEWGVYTGEQVFRSNGDYSIDAIHPTDGSKLSARLTVQGRAVEQVGKPARLDVLKEMARIGGGQYYSSNDFESLVTQLERLPASPALTRRIQWWNHPAVMLGMVAGLGVFWAGRKWCGMV